MNDAADTNPIETAGADNANHVNPVHYALLLMFCAFLIGLIGAGIIKKRASTTRTPPPLSNPENAAKWRRAVAAGDLERAIVLAKSLVTDDEVELPFFDYLTLCRATGVPSAALTRPFNRHDAVRWRDAVKLAKIARDRVKTPRSAVSDLAQAVMTQAKSVERKGDNPKTPSSLMEVWQDGGGPVDQVRLLAELLFQTGLKVSVVPLFDPDNWASHHLCEVRGADGPAVVDVAFGSVWMGKTVSDLRRTPEALPPTWPKTYRDALLKGRYSYLVPAEFADYRRANQRLRTALERSGLENAPRFGVDPLRRIEFYFPEGTAPPDSRRGYWRFPMPSPRSSRRRVP